ncbi:MAG: hypothetical protein EOO39_21320 [Cytophagaceae bacterium]|nr:MAG: hypothetical protein EOO39_21320 [Cytophagaceae bacterium]
MQQTHRTGGAPRPLPASFPAACADVACALRAPPCPAPTPHLPATLCTRVLCTRAVQPRVYETLGEDPHLASQMARNVICGQQGCPRTLADPTKVAACMKHYIGYPNPRSGHDRTPAWLPFRHF